MLWHFAMSLDGFVAGPDHGMDRMAGATVRPGLIDEYVRTTGAVLGDPALVVNVRHRPAQGGVQAPRSVE